MALTLHMLASIVISTGLLLGSLGICSVTLWNLAVYKVLTIFSAVLLILTNKRKVDSLFYGFYKLIEWFIVWTNVFAVCVCVCHCSASPNEYALCMITRVLFPWKDQHLLCMGLGHKANWVWHFQQFYQFLGFPESFESSKTHIGFFI